MGASGWIRELFETIDAMDTDHFLSFLADDAHFRFGNAPVVVGTEAIGRAVNSFFSSIRGTRHRLLATWEHGDVVICQGEVTYTRKDAAQVTIPFVNIFKMEAEKIKRYQIYVDVTPLYT